MKRSFLLLFPSFLLLLGSCHEPISIPDVKNISVDLTVSRLEKDLFNPNEVNLHEYSMSLYRKYGSFYKLYLEQMIGLGRINDPAIGYQYSAFVKDPYMKELYDDVAAIYPDLIQVENELEQAFKYYRYYFPERLIPDVVTFISGFQYNISVTDSLLGVGLDMYLGSNYENYAKSQLFPVYKTKNFRKENLLPDAMLGWLSTEFPLESEDPPTLLQHMIYQGALRQCAKSVLPYTPDSLIMGFTEAQIQWCEENEYHVWTHFVDGELLFSTDSKTIAKYMGEAPFTSGFPEGSPGRIGSWLGYRMVNAHYHKNPDLPLSNLFELNSNSVLKAYKPNK